METETFKEGSFGYDLDFLNQWDEELVVLKKDNAQVLVSPKYQSKVFTSTVSGKDGKSMGWINYKAFGKDDPHMNAYGGENRFWLGPEGNVFSLFFKPMTEMTFENWETPAPIDSEAWDMVNKTENSVSMEKQMELKNYSNHDFVLKAKRTVTILDKDEIENLLEIKTRGLDIVGYKTDNSITNIGDNVWTKSTGAPCIWILDMFPPSKKTTIVIPYRTEAEGEVATTDYFGQIPDNRVSFNEGLLYFKADGKSRGKLGVPPKRATNMAGSYDAVDKILTITLFDIDRHGTYLNQEWNLEAKPFSGDAINAYNDGPLDDGPQMGPFYELESVSPAALLQPGETLGHTHSVFHFTGNEKDLNAVLESIFGIGIKDINEVF
ncbi:MAG: DUF6786 family protein [Saonia sp.]